MSQNPYQAPTEDKPPRQTGTPQPGTCPSCGQEDYRKLSFTWWGGALGPRLFHHVKCNGCGATFNSATGASNTTAIVIYSVVVGVVAIAIFALLFNAF